MRAPRSQLGRGQVALLVAAQACGGDPGALPRVGPVEGTFSVPLDEADPGAGEVELRYLVYPARDPNRRVGTLYVHFGGPGASALQMLPGFVRVLAAAAPEVARRFDVAGFDELGVGASRPLRCPEPTLSYPGADGGAAALAAAADYGRACAARHSALDQLGTNRVVRDLERFRVHLGEDRLDLLGFSYGSMVVLGYAAAFPGRARTVTADGLLDPRAPLEEWLVERGVRFEALLDAWLDACARSPCRFGGRDPQGAFDALLARPDLPLARDTMLGAVAVFLTEPSLEPSLDASLARAAAGDFSAFTEIARLAEAQTTPAAFHGTLCVDRPRPSPEAYRAATRATAGAAPRFGPILRPALLPCVAWPAMTDVFDPALASSAPALLVQAREDPRTLYVWAERVARRLPERAFVEVEGADHGVSLQGNGCVDRIVRRYLVEATLPADATCPP